MLVNLHVKNFAIIDEIDVEFGDHLNILTGETGAGKSILLGSISIALGARVSPELIGKHGSHATVEAVFQIDNEDTLCRLRDLDVEPEDGQLVISRKITENRSVNKINGESVPVALIRKVAALCIDIHGQHEHQSLLNSERHREIVDDYGGEECVERIQKIRSLYYLCREKKKELEQDVLSEEERLRQVGFLEYEKNEIESAALKPGEIEELEENYRMASHMGVIVETLGEVHRLSGDSASGAVSRALRSLQKVSSLNRELEGFTEELMQIEGLLGDFNRDIASFMENISFDERELQDMEHRLDCIRTLQSKYGNTYEEIIGHLDEVTRQLEKYADYEAYHRQKQEEYHEFCQELDRRCEELTAYRKKSAAALESQIVDALSDLNFAHVDFSIEIREKEKPGPDGRDEVEFMIATNPGEQRRSLGKIASGGELSRIMLAIKSVFADSDDIETLIFDEIDAGISGRTAQKVSEKMSVLGRRHQIICITHLAQIAAMADHHYVIEKIVTKEDSTTRIRALERVEMEEELARILGGVEITDAVRKSAREMKQMAEELRQYS